MKNITVYVCHIYIINLYFYSSEGEVLGFSQKFCFFIITDFEFEHILKRKWNGPRIELE